MKGSIILENDEEDNNMKDNYLDGEEEVIKSKEQIFIRNRSVKKNMVFLDNIKPIGERTDKYQNLTNISNGFKN